MRSSSDNVKGGLRTLKSAEPLVPAEHYVVQHKHQNHHPSGDVEDDPYARRDRPLERSLAVGVNIHGDRVALAGSALELECMEEFAMLFGMDVTRHLLGAVVVVFALTDRLWSLAFRTL